MEPIKLKLHIYSGRPNPTWEMGRDHDLYDKIVGDCFPDSAERRLPVFVEDFTGGLGYQGFTLERNNKIVHLPKGTHQEYEKSLFNVMTEKSKHMISDEMLDSISHQLHEEFHMIQTKFNAPNYEPGEWNKPTTGGAKMVQSHNNCYNYGNNKITNTFAQPGKASFFRSGEWMSFTKKLLNDSPSNATSYLDGAVVKRYAELDGLRSIDNPTFEDFKKPDHNGGNLVALVMYPNVDFHWYRLDKNSMWSHKPGSSKATNLDNSGRIIDDPRTCDRDGYTEFVTFMVTNPDKINIA